MAPVHDARRGIKRSAPKIDDLHEMKRKAQRLSAPTTSPPSPAAAPRLIPLEPVCRLADPRLRRQAPKFFSHSRPLPTPAAKEDNPWPYWSQRLGASTNQQGFVTLSLPLQPGNRPMRWSVADGCLSSRALSDIASVSYEDDVFEQPEQPQRRVSPSESRRRRLSPVELREERRTRAQRQRQRAASVTATGEPLDMAVSHDLNATFSKYFKYQWY